ncbi:MAG: ATP-binding cassette domain-containing protein, partial [Spirochaetaceae bacterium]|nr:ATP-binding cassette domain-containing protein [Spirochaetaceae bacterium]
MLSVENLNVHYGVIHAIRDISFEVNQGEIITLIGANGAGKTTTLQAISAIVKKSGGKIMFEDEDISSMPPEQIVKKGLIQVPEGRRVFANMSVKENLELGAFTRKDKAKIASDFEMVFDLFP